MMNSRRQRVCPSKKTATIAEADNDSIDRSTKKDRKLRTKITQIGVKLVEPSRRQPYDDGYLYCDECRQMHYGNCPTHGPMNRIPDFPVAEDDPIKAINSLPSGLSFSRSTISDSELGVFTMLDVPKNTVFGPYKGKEVPFESVNLSTNNCRWLVHGRYQIHWIDDQDLSFSNWLRYVRVLGDNNSEQLNLKSFQYKHLVFYRATKNINKGSELFVCCGSNEERKFESISTADDCIPGNSSTGENMTSALNNEMTGKYSVAANPVINLQSDKASKTCSTAISVISSTTDALTCKPSVDTEASVPTYDGQEPELKSGDVKSGVDETFVVALSMCSQCPLSFSCPTLLKNHVKLVHTKTVGREKCEYCKQHFLSVTYLRTHLKRMHKSEVASAAKKQKKRAVIRNTLRSLKIDSDNEVTGNQNCRRHKALLHTEEEQVPSKCLRTACKQLPHFNRRQLHTHGVCTLYKCVECQRRFEFFRDLVAHQKKLRHKGRDRIKVQSDVDVQVMSIPSKVEAASVERNPKQRGRKANVNGIHKCNNCIRSFNQMVALRTHQLKVHGVDCAACHQQFNKLREFKKHQRLLGHVGQNFVNSSIFQVKTVTVETNPKPTVKPRKWENIGQNTVDSCDAQKLQVEAVVLRRNPKQRGRKWTRNGLHKCHKCNRSFNQLASLKLHISKDHGDTFKFSEYRNIKVPQKIQDQNLRDKVCVNASRLTVMKQTRKTHLNNDMIDSKERHPHKLKPSENLTDLPACSVLLKRVSPFDVGVVTIKADLPLENKLKQELETLIAIATKTRHKVNTEASSKVMKRTRKTSFDNDTIDSNEGHPQTLELTETSTDPSSCRVLLKCHSTYDVIVDTIKANPLSKKKLRQEIQTRTAIITKTRPKVNAEGHANRVVMKLPPTKIGHVNVANLVVPWSAISKQRKCPFCSKDIRKVSDLKGHVSIHGMRMTYKCEKCKLDVFAFVDLKFHQASSLHRGVEIYFAPTNKSKPRIQKVKWQENVLPNARNSNGTGKQLPNVGGGSGHKKNGRCQTVGLLTAYETVRHVCPVCSLVLRRSDYLKYHVFAVHEMSLTYMCKECAGIYPTFAELAAHQAIFGHNGISNKFERSHDGVGQPQDKLENNNNKVVKDKTSKR